MYMYTVDVKRSLGRANPMLCQSPKVHKHFQSIIQLGGYNISTNAYIDMRTAIDNT